MENKDSLIKASVVALVLAIILLVTSAGLMIYDMSASGINNNITLWVIITGSIGSVFSALSFILDKDKE
ncbi:MAG: hypothetical protein UD936_08760 [Acutalibacteraceae bacterium]|nr:hypothetical protein [Acutalibacteraceae bacterium]